MKQTEIWNEGQIQKIDKRITEVVGRGAGREGWQLTFIQVAMQIVESKVGRVRRKMAVDEVIPGRVK